MFLTSLKDLLERTIDVLLYVDRLDQYSVDGQIVASITDSFGKVIWRKEIVKIKRLEVQRLVVDVKRQAYKRLHELELYSEESFIGSPMLLSSLQAGMSNSRNVGQQNVNTLTADEGKGILQLQVVLWVSLYKWKSS